ncbi:MAG: DNA polymerase III subunit beta [Oscillospiraceae bacterium]|nr:DNA polymerase III subunit beta [Oscillospiraceae bacterium]
MKFKCSRIVIMEALNNVSRAASQKSTIPALEGIKLFLNKDVLELTGYDMELGIQTSIGVESDDYGEIVVSSRLFCDIIRKMDNDTVTVEIDENMKTTIKGNAAEYNILAIPADEYPTLPEYDASDSFTLSQSMLKNMINQTIFAVAADEKKPILTGELFDIEKGEFNLVAIDGYRMAIRHEKLGNDDRYNFVVKAKALSEVAKLLNSEEKEEKKENNGDNDTSAENKTNKNSNLVSVNVTKKHIIFSLNGYTVISRLLEGDFHNYRASLPKSHSTEVVINTRELLDSLDRCSLLINEKMKSPVRCLFDNGMLKINCSTALGKLSDEIKADISGNPLEIGFNCRYISEAVRAVGSDMVKLELSGGLAPMVIKPVQGDEFVFLVLPVRLKSE